MPSKKNNADKSTDPAAGATVTPASPPAATGLSISAEALESSATTTSTPEDSAASSLSGDDAASVAAGSGSADQSPVSASGDGSASVAGDANPPAALASEADPASATPPAAETGSVTPPPPVSAGQQSASPAAAAPLPPFPWETALTVEIPAAVPVVAPAVVDAIAAVPDDHRSDYRQLISSLAAVNHGLDNATHALTALRNLCRNDSGRELLVARGIDAPAVLTRLFYFLGVPDAV